jgi:hypothetical protein
MPELESPETTVAEKLRELQQREYITPGSFYLQYSLPLTAALLASHGHLIEGRDAYIVRVLDPAYVAEVRARRGRDA